MKTKLKLQLDELEVSSFETDQVSSRERGTVVANSVPTLLLCETSVFCNSRGLCTLVGGSCV